MLIFAVDKRPQVFNMNKQISIQDENRRNQRALQTV
jgi:hypothetical protein